MMISRLASIFCVTSLALFPIQVLARPHHPVRMHINPLLHTKLRSPPTSTLRPCKDVFPLGVPKPTLVHKLTIPAKLDPHHILAKRATHKINVGGTDEDPHSPDMPYVFDSNNPIKTLMDLNLHLEPGGAVLIKVIVADAGSNIFLRGDKYAITSSSTEPEMFCSVKDFIDEKSAIFEAFYVAPTSPGTYVFGAFNIGLVIYDNNQYGFSMPLFLDPEVKNNG